VISAALAAPATALTLSPGGTGQVLVYPYYTVNGNQQTLLSVVNATNRVKAVKVRFLEGRNGKPVLDFNLYLSPFDVWAAAISATGNEGPATLATSDRSCTVPQIAPLTVFRASRYTGAEQDWASATTPISLAALLGSIERTREGHIEMIEMGLLQIGTLSTQLAEEATHNAAGVPTNCQRLVEAWSAGAGGWAFNAQANIDAPRGALYGGAIIVDVAKGTLQSYEADAIEGFYTNSAEPGFLHRPPTDSRPDLGDADNGQGRIEVGLVAEDGSFITQQVPARQRTLSTTAPYSFDAMSLVYMHAMIHNEFVTERTLGAASEWVLTFPTKSAYVDTTASAMVRRPFTDAFRDNGTACEAMTISYWNREELVPGTVPGSVDFPVPPGIGPSPPSICQQANVIAFNQDAVLFGGASAVLAARSASGLRTITVSGSTFTTGWTRIWFDNPNIANFQNTLDNRVNDPAGGISLAGLPVTGFWAVNYTNANVIPGVLANYSGTTRHRAMRTAVQPP
jgi:hypothetical protein